MKTINNNIEERRVSFPVAKLLKEAGFDCNVVKCYAEERLIDKNTGGDLFTGVYRLCDKSRFHKRYYLAPTQQLAIDWIRVNFGIHIYTYPVAPFVTENEDYPELVWVSKLCSLQQVNFEKFINTDNGLAINHFHTSEEAKEAALEYVLTNLILKK